MGCAHSHAAVAPVAPPAHPAATGDVFAKPPSIVAAGNHLGRVQPNGAVATSGPLDVDWAELHDDFESPLSSPVPVFERTTSGRAISLGPLQHPLTMRDGGPRHGWAPRPPESASGMSFTATAAPASDDTFVSATTSGTIASFSTGGAASSLSTGASSLGQRALGGGESSDDDAATNWRGAPPRRRHRPRALGRQASEGGLRSPGVAGVPPRSLERRSSLSDVMTAHAHLLVYASSALDRGHAATPADGAAAPLGPGTETISSEREAYLRAMAATGVHGADSGGSAAARGRAGGRAGHSPGGGVTIGSPYPPVGGDILSNLELAIARGRAGTGRAGGGRAGLGRSDPSDRSLRRALSESIGGGTSFDAKVSRGRQPATVAPSRPVSGSFRVSRAERGGDPFTPSWLQPGGGRRLGRDQILRWVQSWTTDKVTLWLVTIGFGPGVTVRGYDVGAMFRAARIDGPSLLAMDCDRLRDELGIGDLALRNRIMACIAGPASKLLPPEPETEFGAAVHFDLHDDSGSSGGEGDPSGPQSAPPGGSAG